MAAHFSDISSIADYITTSCIDIWLKNEHAGTGSAIRHISTCLPSLVRTQGTYKKKNLSQQIIKLILSPLSNNHCIALRLASICFSDSSLDEGIQDALFHALNSRKKEELIEAILAYRKLGEKAGSTKVCTRLLQIVEQEDFFLKGIAFDALKGMGFLQKSNVHAMLQHMALTNPMIRHLLETNDAVPKAEKMILKYVPATPQSVRELLLDLKSTSMQKRFRAAKQLENIMLNGIRIYEYNGQIILKNLSDASARQPDDTASKTKP